MLTKPLPPLDTLRKLLEYDPETGILLWKWRDHTWFSCGHNGSKDTPGQILWNAKYSGKPALDCKMAMGKGGNLLRQHLLSHRVIWKLHSGKEPVGKIDHFNGDNFDNRWVNLRDVTASQNSKNLALRSDNTSGYVGVWWANHMQKWSAQIRSEGKVYCLGYFDDINDAVAARLAKQQEFGFSPTHGKRRKLSFPR